MLYSLVLVIFLSNGVEHRVPLVNKFSDESCIDLRDDVRANIDYLNNLEEPVKFEGEVVEFVDVECVNRSIVY